MFQNCFIFFFITVEMPELFDLIFKNRETSHDTVRWSLLAWMFNLNDKVVDELRKLKIERTTVVITICHLLQVRKRSANEF